LQKIRRSYFPDNVCDEHSIFDMLPCPWPDCVNGCSEDQFELIDDSIDRSETYTRREWHSPLGGHYYSWDGERLPNWFGLENVVWREGRRLGVVDIPKIDVVYHYTSLEGLKGIVESNCIWLSDYSYLNDSKELLHGIELTKSIVSKMLKNKLYRVARGIIDSWCKNLDEIEHRVCIASFSSDGDSLSQWRSYGNLAIGFKSGINMTGFAHETLQQPVIYCQNKQEKLTELLLSHMCQTYAFDKNAGRLQRIEDVYHKTEKIIKLTSFYKNLGFKDEAEYRMVYLEDADLFENMGQPCAPKRFRISANSFIPYVQSNELPGYKHDKLPIHSIVLGPSASLLLECGLREFLNAHDYEEAQICRSKIPFRT